MHDEEGRFKPDQFPELPPTKSCAGTTKGATLTVQDDLYVSLLLHSHSFPSQQLCVLTLFLVLPLVYA